MFGAIFGDIIGSYYEVHCTKDYDFEFQRESTFTDDSVMTAAVCRSIINNPSEISKKELISRAKEYAMLYKQFYSHYPYAGYGELFKSWAADARLYKIKSFGNGAAMRVVPIGYAYKTLEQVLLQAKASCIFTHKHKNAITGAQAVAAAVWLANNGSSKNEIRTYIRENFGYKLSASVDEIRSIYKFDCLTSYSVPPSIIAFLESSDYESAVRNAVSLGGDADTMACIAGGIAEAFYHKIPKAIEKFCWLKIDSTIKLTVNEFCDKYIVNKTEYI